MVAICQSRSKKKHNLDSGISSPFILFLVTEVKQEDKRWEKEPTEQQSYTRPSPDSLLHTFIVTDMYNVS